MSTHIRHQSVDRYTAPGRVVCYVQAHNERIARHYRVKRFDLRMILSHIYEIISAYFFFLRFPRYKIDTAEFRVYLQANARQ